MTRHQIQGNVEPQLGAPRPIDPSTWIGHVHLRTADIDRVRDGCAGLHHLAIAYPTRGGLADGYLRLHEAGWPIRQATDHGTHEAIYITDPDGNDVELMWDRPFEEWPAGEEGPFSVFADLDLDTLREAA